jgi:hypothetical protein
MSAMIYCWFRSKCCDITIGQSVLNISCNIWLKKDNLTVRTMGVSYSSTNWMPCFPWLFPLIRKRHSTYRRKQQHQQPQQHDQNLLTPNPPLSRTWSGLSEELRQRELQENTINTECECNREILAEKVSDPTPRLLVPVPRKVCMDVMFVDYHPTPPETFNL